MDSDGFLDAPWGALGRSATLGIVSGLSKFLMNVMNTTTFHNLEIFHKIVMERKNDVGLITVCNHTSTIDDPVLFSAMIPWRYFYTDHQHHNMRWSLCARELCYRNTLLAQFFQSGKTLPVERGAGLHQPVMRAVAGEVSRGKWVHVFPEGRVNYTGVLGPLRWGVGKLVCDAVAKGHGTPIVLPFYHSGMAEVMPFRARFPHWGHQVTVIVGQPVPLDDLTCKCNAKGEELAAVWKDITDRVGAALRELEAQCPANTANPDALKKLGSRNGNGGAAAIA